MLPTEEILAAGRAEDEARLGRNQLLWEEQGEEEAERFEQD